MKLEKLELEPTRESIPIKIVEYNIGHVKLNHNKILEYYDSADLTDPAINAHYRITIKLNDKTIYIITNGEDFYKQITILREISPEMFIIITDITFKLTVEIVRTINNFITSIN